MAKSRAQYWLMKSEPDVYSIDDLERDGREPWGGVRNFQARNYMRAMRVGDLALFYHSSSKPMGVVGVMRIASLAHPDPSQFDAKSPYYDSTSPTDEPRWDLVDVEFVEKLAKVVTLAELKDDAKLDGMLVTRKGNRLSVTPVEQKHFAHVLRRAGASTKL